MNEYTAEQLENVRMHCESGIAVRKYWADNLPDEIIRSPHIALTSKCSPIGQG